MLPILFNERNIEPNVIKKANQFNSFKFGVVQFSDILNLRGGVTSLDSYLDHTKLQKQKDASPTNGLVTLNKMQNTELPPQNAFYSK